MIFLTVGTQLPFDRLVRAMDDLAPRLGEPVVAQIGKSSLRPIHLDWMDNVTPARFEQVMRDARIIVSHAGIGTILAAQKHGKPIVLMPREARYGEHRNDHQLATCRQLGAHSNVFIARNGTQIETILLRSDIRMDSAAAPRPARASLIDFLSEFFSDDAADRRC